MNSIKNRLFELQDLKYKRFQEKLIPNIDSKYFIGVRTPDLRSFAKELYRTKNYSSFINNLPHKYFDENQLHAFIICEIKDYNECINYLNKFLPYINNWATCDQLSPKIFKKNKDKLLNEINKWINSKDIYTIRFGIGMLMKYFLDSDFKKEYLDLICNVKSDEYYVNMMKSWFFASSLAKQYESTIPYIQNYKLDMWTHNKTIQKCIESNRISNNIKDYLNKFKIK